MRLTATAAISAVLALCSIFVAACPASASSPYLNYGYDLWGNVVPAPQAYVLSREIDGIELGVGRLNNPTDIFVAHDRSMYVVDSGNNRIIRLSPDFEVVGVISKLDNSGEGDYLQRPGGLFVTSDGHIYVADTGNARVVELDQDGRLIREIGPPRADAEGLIPDGFVYRPSKVVVDPAGRIRVIATGVYDGLLEFDAAGNFRGFVGAPRVTPSLLDYLWQRISTREQRERMAAFLPAEFSGFDLDQRGFVYATVSDSSVQRHDAIRRLNPKGQDILRRRGFFAPVGDVAYYAGPSVFVDIAVSDHGIYHALDYKRGRVFTYDDSGNLLYIFGGLSDQKGAFYSPVAIDAFEDSIIVLDSCSGCLSIYEPTEYASLILAAIRLYESGHYDRATDAWRQVLKLNANYDLAYTGIGKALYRQGEYREAMRYFALGNDRPGYSDALASYREEIVERHLGTAVMLAVALGLVVCLWRTVSRRRNRVRQRPARTHGGLRDALAYSLHVIFHPFDGFFDLKHERRGTPAAAAVILLAVCFTYIFVRQYTGFAFNYRDLKRLNVIMEAVSVLVPFFLWSGVNWALTTLMDGKGSFMDVVIASAYALVPLVLINIPAALLSNVITIEEGSFYYFLVAVGVIWSAALLFIGTMVTHEYDFGKSVFTSLLVIPGMVIVLFLGLLFFDLIDQIVAFVSDIYIETTFRL